MAGVGDEVRAGDDIWGVGVVEGAGDVWGVREIGGVGTIAAVGEISPDWVAVKDGRLLTPSAKTVKFRTAFFKKPSLST